MTTTDDFPTGDGPDADDHPESRPLRLRAAHLRTIAESLDTVLAVSWRRRASELELEAWLLEARAGRPFEVLRSAA